MSFHMFIVNHIKIRQRTSVPEQAGDTGPGRWAKGPLHEGPRKVSSEAYVRKEPQSTRICGLDPALWTGSSSLREGAKSGTAPKAERAEAGFRERRGGRAPRFPLGLPSRAFLLCSRLLLERSSRQAGPPKNVRASLNVFPHPSPAFTPRRRGSDGGLPWRGPRRHVRGASAAERACVLPLPPPGRKARGSHGEGGTPRRQGGRLECNRLNTKGLSSSSFSALSLLGTTDCMRRPLLAMLATERT